MRDNFVRKGTNKIPIDNIQYQAEFLWLFFFLLKGSLNVDKYHENILLTVPKGTRDKLRAYALIKGYKNEQQLIAKLIADEIEKDKDKLQ